MSTYPGDTTTLNITYKVVDVLTDPDGVQVSVKDPLGETLISLASATHDSTGHYHYDYTYDEDALTGEYTFTWTITVDTTVSTYSQLIDLDLPLSSTHYANADTIKSDLAAHDKVIRTDSYAIVDSAINKAETLINGKLGITDSIEQSDVSEAMWNVLVQAANLTAESLIMHNLYSKGDKKSQTAVAYEEEADIILKPYIPG